MINERMKAGFLFCLALGGLKSREIINNRILQHTQTTFSGPQSENFDIINTPPRLRITDPVETPNGYEASVCSLDPLFTETFSTINIYLFTGDLAYFCPPQGRKAQTALAKYSCDKKMGTCRWVWKHLLNYGGKPLVARNELEPCE